MKILAAFMGCVLILGVSAYIGMPFITEEMIKQECSQASPSQDCLVRMRVAGHIRSQRGDLLLAKSWYQRSADQGDAIAMFHLAWIYEELAYEDLLKFRRSRGDQVNVDDSLLNGMKYVTLRQAIDDPTIPENLKNEGNWQHAKSWYLRSANLGFSSSMNNLARMHLLGLGGDRDPHRAYLWYLDAVKADNPVSVISIGIAQALAGTGVSSIIDSGVWKPKNGITCDLQEPTLARTRGLDFDLPESARSRFREVAKNGESVWPMDLIPDPADPKYYGAIRPMKRNSTLPTFNDIVKKLENSD